MKARHALWLVLIVTLITSCGVSELKKRYPPDVVKKIERIVIFPDDVPAEARSKISLIELGFVEVHDNLLRSWEYLEFMAKAQAYQRYGDVDIIIRATFDIERVHPLADALDQEKLIRGTAARFSNRETRDWFFKAYDEWQKEQSKQEQ